MGSDGPRVFSPRDEIRQLFQRNLKGGGQGEVAYLILMLATCLIGNTSGQSENRASP